LPLIHRIFTYLPFPVFTREYLVGDAIITQAATTEPIKVIIPGSEFVQTPVIEQGKLIVKISDTRRPGIYKIGNDVFAINVIAEEGNLLRVSEREISNQNVRILNDVSGKTTDLSRLSLAFAVIFFISELILLIV
jgi:hypothetical protein